MTDTPTDAPPSELPVWPTSAPEVFSDPPAAVALMSPVLAALAEVVDVDPSRLDGPTPCAGFTVGELRRHTLAWLQFFAAALGDPDAEGDRLDPDTWDLGDGDDPAAIVSGARADIEAAIAAGCADRLVVMTSARMAGSGVLAMALGEYIVHGWDLATATGRPWSANDDAVGAAHAFLATMVAPEHRGPDSGFFDQEVPAPPDATALQRLLCFGGRRPDWTPT